MLASTRGRQASIAILATVAALALFGFAPTPAGAAFGFKQLGVDFSAEGGATAGRAGSHPLAWTTSLSLNTIPGSESGELPEGELKDLRIQLPAGLVGTPGLLPRCPRADFLAGTCSADAALGDVALETSAETKGSKYPLYNLIPQPGSAAEVGFVVLSVPVTMEIGIKPGPPFNLVVSLTNASQAARFFGSVLTIDGFSGETPFLTLPRSCDGPLSTIFEADSWQAPGAWASASTQTQDQAEPPEPLILDGCADLGFSPELTVSPTATGPQKPTGLDLSFEVDDEGWRRRDVPVQSDLREVTLSLPEGLTLNPAVAAGLGVCTPVDLARETATSAFGEGCPSSAKIGTVEVQTPLFGEALAGSLFVAQPDRAATTQPGAENPFDALLALYVVVKSPARGVLVAQAARIEPDPGTGRLVATVREMPQLPLSRVELHLRGGERSPLQSPGACGTYTAQYRLTPWSGTAPLDGSSRFAIGQSCAAGDFAPHLRVGSVDPQAGSSSAFVLDLSRRDGEQNVSGLSVRMPRGLSARFAGIPLCQEAAALSGSCPVASRVGSLNVAAGSGAEPLWIPPTAESAAPVYLAGPYKGAPFSLAFEVPALAGPFDLGAVVLRAAIHIDPVSAQATVELDALPQILEGVPIDYRAIHLELDRPGFLVNPTSCEPMRVHGRLSSSQGRTASSSDLFQAAGCAELGFRPGLSLRTIGPTRRGAHPSLRATLRTREGEANVRRLALTLPGTMLLDYRHIEEVCSSAQFARQACPAGSRYGYAEAWSPLLDERLRGPVYLRASDRKLPDLIASLGGPFAIDLTARVDSAHGRLRLVLDRVPDVSLRRFVLTMKGGRKGLLVNTGGLCSRPRRAVANFLARNAKRQDLRPIVSADCR